MAACSLVKRDGARRSLTVHRLVQTVIRYGMPEELQRRCAEQAVTLVHEAFVTVEDTGSWPARHRQFPHARTAAGLIEEWGLRSREAAILLCRVGRHLQTLGHLGEARATLVRARRMAAEVMAADD